MDPIGVNLSAAELDLLVDVLGRHARHVGCPESRRLRARLLKVQGAPGGQYPPAPGPCRPRYHDAAPPSVPAAAATETKAPRRVAAGDVGRS